MLGIRGGLSDPNKASKPQITSNHLFSIWLWKNMSIISLSLGEAWMASHSIYLYSGSYLSCRETSDEVSCQAPSARSFLRSSRTQEERHIVMSPKSILVIHWANCWLQHPPLRCANLGLTLSVSSSLTRSFSWVVDHGQPTSCCSKLPHHVRSRADRNACSSPSVARLQSLG